MHQFVDQRCDQEQDHAGAQQGPEAEGVAGQGRLHRHAARAADVAGEDARQVVAGQIRRPRHARTRLGEVRRVRVGIEGFEIAIGADVARIKALEFDVGVN